MNLQDLQNKKIAILGLGIENYHLVKFLMRKKINCEITIADMRDSEIAIQNSNDQTLLKLPWKTGTDFNRGLDKFDILFRSPGWPIKCPGIQSALRKKKTILSSPMKLFFDLSPTKNIIGVTGTKGKGTTATLIYNILKADKRSVYLGGNIGTAPFEFFDKLRKNDYVVLELSSFQLEDLHTSPRIAVITNLYEEHLAPADPKNPNYHRSMREYWKAKSNIYLHQGEKGKLVISNNFQYSILPPTLKLRRTSNTQSRFKSSIIKFFSSGLLSNLTGEYNKENIGAAVEVAKLLKIKKEIYSKAIAKFSNLPHRLEFVANINGVKYFDNSFATTPDATILDLDSFENIILLLGGADKGSSFRKLAQVLKKRVKFTILLDGAGTKRILGELKKVNYHSENMQIVESMKEAIKIAKKMAVCGDTVLLSTACASFGMFQNYKERGDLFQKEILKKK